MTTQSIAKQIEFHLGEVKRLRELEKQLAAERFVQCGECKKRSKIKSVVFIQTHWYVPPRGCTEGAYWNPGEGQFICPKCGIRNRLLSDESKKLNEIKGCFAEVKDDYDHNQHYPFVNI